MHHPGTLVVELDLLHRQARQPEQQRRVAPARVVLNHLNLRTLNQARDLTFVTMNCLDNSHDHRGHGPYRVTTQGPRARSSSKSLFDPFDLTDITVRYAGREVGTAIAHVIGRHVHPAVKSDSTAAPAPVTGIDYLALVRDRHTQVMTQRVNYASITQPAVHPQAAANAVLPGQVDLLDLLDPTPTVHHEPDHQEIP